MIWDLLQQSEFDKHFSTPDLTITTLLLDENIITELKNQNPKLLDHLNTHKQEFITELIQYTTTMPKQSDGHDRCHKLPYISSQLLAIDSQLIYQQFFKEEIKEQENINWKQLISFLDTPAAQNEILMGYFQKVIHNLYNGNKTKTTCLVAFFLDKFISLVYNGSIGDILKNCLILLNTPEGEAITQRTIILQRIVVQCVTGNEQVKNICSQVLSQVVNRFQAFSSGDILVQKILQNQRLKDIYKLQNDQSINNFLVGLLTKSQQQVVNQHDQKVKLLSLPSHHLQSLNQYLKREVDRLEDMTSSSQYITNQNRVTVRKSNKKIYSLLNLISLAIEQNLEGFLSAKLVKNLWNLLMLYPYNNILQVSVMKIFKNILKSSKTQIRNIFLNHYELYAIELYKSNFEMFRPLIYTLWTLAKPYPTITTDEAALKQYSSLIHEKLQPLTQYQIKESTKHHQNFNKLVVDQEDTRTLAENEESQPHIQKTQSIPLQEQQKVPQESSEPQKDAFEFFGEWLPNEKEKKIESKSETNLFDDFSNFF